MWPSRYQTEKPSAPKSTAICMTSVQITALIPPMAVYAAVIIVIRTSAPPVTQNCSQVPSGRPGLSWFQITTSSSVGTHSREPLASERVARKTALATLRVRGPKRISRNS